MFKVINCIQQAFDFLPAKDRGQFPGTGAGGYLKLGLLPLTKPSVETDKAGQIGIHRTPGQLAIFQKIEKIVLNLFVGQGVGGLVIIFRRNRRLPPDILMPTSPDTFQHFILICCA